MKPLILTLLLLLSTSTWAHDWTRITERVERSLVRVTHTGEIEPGTHVCGGFVINRLRGYVLTAYHCLLDGDEEKDTQRLATYFQVDGLPSYIVQEWPDDDLVIVNVLPVGKPSLDYRRKPLRKGLPVAALGHAYGLTTSTLLVGVIAAPEAAWASGARWLTMDRHSIGGMSGGPIFDEDGRVIGVMQRTDDRTYVSRPLARVLALTRKFWD